MAFTKKPALPLILLACLLVILVAAWYPGTMRAGDNIDFEFGGVIIDSFWDQRLFGGAPGFPAAIEVFLNPAGIPADVPQASFEVELGQAFDNWEAVDDGLVEEPVVPVINLVGTTAVSDARALDGVNAITWVAGAPGGTLAAAPCWRLTEAATTEDDGFGNTVLPLDVVGSIPFPGPPGVTYQKGSFIDCGIEFDNADSWSVSAGPAAGKFDVQAVGTHEAGHFIGLSHSTVGLLTGPGPAAATMAPFGATNDIEPRSLEEDDRASVLRTYARTGEPPLAQTLGDRGIIQLNLRKGGACDPATGVSVWAYRTSEGQSGTNRLETFSGSQLRAGLPGEPVNGSVTLNVQPLPPGESYTIYAHTLDSSPESAPTIFSSLRYNHTTINSNFLDPPGQSRAFDNLATVSSISAGQTVDLGDLGIGGCWTPVSGSNIDLSADSVTAPASATLGGHIEVTSAFSNQGSEAAGPFQAEIYFSTDPVINSDDVTTGFTCSVAGLAAGANGACNGLVSIPSLTPGSYYVGLLVDIDNQVGESNESNNGVATAGTIELSSDPLNPIVNGSFETGDLSGWSVKEITPASNPNLPLGVGGAGVEYPAPTFSAPPFVLDYFTSEPTDGQWAVLHDFNGDDPATSEPVNRRELYQDLQLPARTQSLLFDYRAAWELFRFGSTMDRTFSVEIEPAGGGSPLLSQVILSATNGGFEEDTENPSGGSGVYPGGGVDLSAFEGQTVRIKFVWNIPEPGTGFAFFQLDNVRITAADPDSPLVDITAPAEGSSFSETDQVSFAGTAIDPQDGDLTAGLSWSSSLDGSIGSGGAFSASGLSTGVHEITAFVTDSSGKTGFDTTTITILNTPPTVSISSPAEGAVLTAGANVAFAGTAVDPGDGDLSAGLSWTSSLDGFLGVGANISAPLTQGLHLITASVTDSGGALGSASVSVTAQVATPASLQWENLVVSGVTNTGWTSAGPLEHSYTSPVVVCSPNYDNTAPPLVPRLQNTAGNSFDVRVDRLDATPAAPVSADLHCVVVEEGAYAEATHGVTMEAVKFTSTLTDHAASWIGQGRSYVNSYSSPVVVGQVMTYNDPNFSVFWSRGANLNSPPDSNNLVLGKHAGEDPNVTRANETVGYIVIESGGGTAAGQAYQAGLGADTVEGVDDAPPYQYGLGGFTSVSAAVVSQATVEGLNGGWAVLYGSGALTPSALSLAIDEDQLSDTERLHIAEQVSYLVFGTAPVPAPDPFLENAVVSNVSNAAWTTVPLARSYTSMVAVCAPNYDVSAPPLVPRIQNAAGSSFDLRVDRADGSTQPVAGITVHCAAVEEGFFTEAEHGVKMEAVKFTSTVTDHATSWIGQQRSYSNSYTSPVVVGQVMSYNDANFSAFWARGADVLTPPSANNLHVGKHVGEDPNTSRANETVGYIVFESGAGTVSGVNYEAGVGPDTVAGFDDAPPYSYGLNGFTAVSSAVVSQATMEGANGGWAALYGPGAVSPSGLNLAVDEDQVADAERRHALEQVAFVAFGAVQVGSPPAVAITSPADGSQFDQGSEVPFAGSANDPEEGDLSANLTWTSDIDGAIGAGAGFSTTALSVGTHLITASVTDGDGNEGSAAISLGVGNTPPSVVITTPSDGDTLTAGAGVLFTGAATDTGDGDLSANLSWTSSLDGVIGAGASFSAALTAGAHTITASVLDSGGLAGSHVINVTVNIASPANLVWENLVVSGVSNTGWTTAGPLANAYLSPVVVCSPNYDNTAPPLVPRVRNPGSGSFEVRLDRLDTTPAAAVSADLHCVVVEEGAYTEATHGVTMEAVKLTSSITDNASSWVGESRSYVNAYASPVVMGQVMSYNDPNFSVFWSRGVDLNSPPDSTNLVLGKHVGEDPNTVRANETVGYIVIESGNGEASGVAYEAAVGPDLVAGFGDAPPYNYSLATLETVSAAVVSQATLEGLNGGWAALYGLNPVTPSSLALAIDEDQVADAERFHAPERAAYLAFGTAAVPPPDPSLERVVVANVDNTAWTTVNLSHDYASMVAVCSPNYDGSVVSLVPRLQNAGSGNSFDLRVDRTDGLADPLPAGVDVHCTVVEEGVYNQLDHGVTMEAVKFTSTITDNSSSWAGESRAYANTYINPVVVGQVMSYNDSNFSVFWASGRDRRSPPDANNLALGKHVGEDPNTSRAGETVGYIVIESGAGTVSGVNYEAGLGADTVKGVDDKPPYSYSLTGALSTVSAAVVSQAAMQGANGGWAILYGASPASASTLSLAIDEDQARDSERRHTTEPVSYLVFE